MSETHSPHGDRWPRFAWVSAAGLVVVASVVGFLVLGRVQQNAGDLDAWTAICRAIGIGGDSGPAAAAQPPLQTPSMVTWDPVTLDRISGGKVDHGAFIALNCTACHGEQGVSQADIYPTLAGMDAAVIYKQLEDFRAGKRAWGAMNGIAHALSAQDMADVGTYYAERTNGLEPITRAAFGSGRSLRESDPATRLAYSGDPARGIPACSACHGPGDGKLGAPSLLGQRPVYIERQLLAFAQGSRRNDINEQMRIIASQLTPDEMHAVAELYGSGKIRQ